MNAYYTCILILVCTWCMSCYDILFIVYMYKNNVNTSFLMSGSRTITMIKNTQIPYTGYMKYMISYDNLQTVLH